MILALVMIAGFLLLAGLLVWTRPQPVAKDPLLSETIVIHTQDDITVRGVLLANHADSLVLTEAIYVGSTGDTGLDGLVHIPRDNIRFFQHIETSNIPERRLKVAE